MRFDFVPCATIPRLSWCAELVRGSGVASVYHGPWVETRDGWFVEGAWAGPFEKGGLDSAVVSAGTGGVVRAAQVVFCAATDMIGRLFSLRKGDRLFISNSMTFVLAMAGDEPDPSYPFYARKLRAYQKAGTSTTHKTFHTNLGRQVRLHEFCQLAVGEDLRLIRVEKPAYPRPASLEAYLSTLREVLGDVLDNAASPERRQRYEGLATVSRGYDSNALAALSSGLGVREALTLYLQVPGDESGEEIARHLGMTAHVYGQSDFRAMPAVDEAEFLSWPDPLSGITWAPCEERLAGRILITGQWGDKTFGMSDPEEHRDFRGSPTGCGRMLEFRLRTGFLNVNPLFAGGMHLEAMRAISTAPNMRPWRLGGDYDRPIARRILEEAGVPRGIFGLGKAGVPRYRFRSPADLRSVARADFETYLRSMPRWARLRHTWYRAPTRLGTGGKWLARQIRRRISWRAGTFAESLIPAPLLHRSWDVMDFTMHWAHARIQPRYAEAVRQSQSEQGTSWIEKPNNLPARSV